MTEHNDDVRTQLLTMWDRVRPGIGSPEMSPRITHLSTGDALAKVPDGFTAWGGGRLSRRSGRGTSRGSAHRRHARAGRRMRRGRSVIGTWLGSSRLAPARARCAVVSQDSTASRPDPANKALPHGGCCRCTSASGTASDARPTTGPRPSVVGSCPFLDGVVGLVARPQHPERDRPEVVPVVLLLLRVGPG
jgi:hypothetical protein